MEAILLSMLSGLVINLITWLSWKLWVSKTYVSVGLSVLIWVILYAGQLIVNKYPLQREQIVEFCAWAYATSQCIRNLANKRWILKKE